MAVPSSRSARGGGGGGGGGGGVTTTTAGKSNGSNHRSNHHASGGGAARDSNDAKNHPNKLVLARGYTSRLLPPTGTLQALTSDEVEKDLLHFQAYHRAVITYRQQYYLAVNPNHTIPQPALSGSTSLLASPSGSATGGTPIASSSATSGGPYGGGGGGGGAPLVVASLPVRIDPEEEKRLALLRRKIARAEWLREDLEQRYVALRAHYVQSSQEVRHVQEQVSSRQEFLKMCVKERAATLGLTRARLQMTRDVLAALQRRGHVLGQAAAAAAAAQATSAESTTTSTVPATDSSGATKDPMLLENVWNQVEEELKKQHRKLGNSKSSAKVVSWPCTRMPPTPFGVPILLSNASDAPERTVAFGANGVFGSDKQSSLVWTLPETVPRDDYDGNDGANRVGGAVSPRRQELDDLNDEVSILQAELDKERIQNQEISDRIARARSKNDEWVAMICLVRQETEAVLHRHNVVLDSDLARDASERWFAQDQDTKKQRLNDSSSSSGAAAAAAPSDAAIEDAESMGVQVREVEVPLASVGEGNPEDEDNDGDDEGSEEEEPQDRDGPSMGGEANSNPRSTNKRAAHKGEASDLEDARKKRRIV